MLGKKIFRRLGWGGVAILLVVLWAQMPIIAQEKTLAEQLREAKKVIDDQMWIITQLKDNFYQTTNDLMKEIDSLKASYSDQTEAIKPIAEKYLEITEELNALIDFLAVEGAQLKAQVDSLTAKNAELEKTNIEQVKIIKELTDKYLKVTEELNALIGFLTVEGAQLKVQVDSLTAKNAELEKTNVEQVKIIKELTDKYLKVTEELNTLIDFLTVEGAQLKAQVDSLTAKNAELEKTNVEQVKIIKELTDKYLKVTEELNTLLTEVLAAKDAELEVMGVEQAKTIKEMTDDFFKTTEKFNAQIKELNSLVNSLTAESTQLKAQVESLTAKNTELEEANAEQAKTVKEITDDFLKVRWELKAQIGSLTAKNAELKAQIGSLTAKNSELNAQIDSLTAKNSELNAQIDFFTAKNSELNAIIDSLTAKNAELKDQIDSLTAENAELNAQIDFFTAENSELNAQIDFFTAENAELEEANTEQAKTIEEMTEDFFRVTGELNSEVTSLKAAKDEDMATIKKLETQRIFLGIGVLVLAVLAISK